MTDLQVIEWLKRVTPSTGKGVVLGIGPARFRSLVASRSRLW